MEIRKMNLSSGQELIIMIFFPSFPSHNPFYWFSITIRENSTSYIALSLLFFFYHPWWWWWWDTHDDSKNDDSEITITAIQHFIQCCHCEEKDASWIHKVDKVLFSFTFGYKSMKMSAMRMGDIVNRAFNEKNKMRNKIIKGMNVRRKKLKVVEREEKLGVDGRKWNRKIYCQPLGKHQAKMKWKERRKKLIIIC